MKRGAQSLLLRKRRAIAERLDGREHASSTSLSMSFDLPIQQVRSIMREKGVMDDG